MMQLLAGIVPTSYVSRVFRQESASSVINPTIPPAPTPIPASAGFGVAPGPFQASWESLYSYQVPDWYRDAKFGIWAHWGPQCQPEMGDWYAQRMYQEGNAVYQWHCEKYGHPSKFGFKDVINEWKAEKWDPEALVTLYKKAGAKFFAAMANHHDNLDMWDSTYTRLPPTMPCDHRPVPRMGMSMPTKCVSAPAAAGREKPSTRQTYAART